MQSEKQETPARTAKRHQLPADALELEVAENIVRDGDDLILETLERIRASGALIAFDDFGTGFAPLGPLKKYP